MPFRTSQSPEVAVSPSERRDENIDSGTWILKCKNCDTDFQLEVTAGEKVVERAKEAACPHCQKTPAAATGVWHHIIGFRNTRDE